MRNINFITTTIQINRDDWRRLKSKLAMRGMSIAEWIRHKVSQELNDN